MRLFDRMLSLVRFSPLLVVILVLLVPQTIIAGVPIQNTLTGLQGDGRQANQAKVQANIAEIPLSFIANAGQANANVRFMVKAGKQTIFFTPKEVVFAAGEGQEGEDTRSSVVRLSFVEANKEVRVEGEKPLPGVANFFLGNDPEQWRTNVSTYAAITYRDLYPGIDLFYSGRQGRLKSEFVVAAGADPTVIIMDYGGVSSMYVREDGTLVLETPIGELVEAPPLIYQMIGEERVTVEGGYRLLGEGQVAFTLEDYVPTEPLIIDPSIEYSTYLGGSGGDFDWGLGISVDASGNACIVGTTLSTNFPVENPFQATLSGNRAVFVAKLNASGSALIYSTYLGGSDDDEGSDIAVDETGNVYIAGDTGSTDFPTKNAFQSSLCSEGDGFITKLNPTGSSLVYSTYLGGSQGEGGYGIAVDVVGNAYVTGSTCSTDFPTTAGAFQTVRNGDCDAFITKLNPTGSSLVYSTYLGGSSWDSGYAVAVDVVGNAYIVGGTPSPDFPMKNAFQATYAGGTFNAGDAFVVKLNPAGSTLVYSTYLGGSAEDDGAGIAVDATGRAYVIGITNSTDFPTKDPLQPLNCGGRDAFVAKLSTSGSALLYSTYLGGSNYDYGRDILVDDSGDAYVTGKTWSTNFPTRDSFQFANAGAADAFLTKINALGSAIVYSTYFGGTDTDGGYGVDIDTSGNVYVTGLTNSMDFPTKGPFQAAKAGGFDAFVAKIGEANGQVVSFPDPNLEQAIRDAIGIPTGDIHDTDLIGLTFLDAELRGIANLEGIQHCVDLTRLDLDDNEIVNISPLSGLTNLTLLDLGTNQIVDISPLSGLTNLTYLDLQGNQIVDISPLSGLTNLTYLPLPGNEIVDISPLSGLTNLTELALSDNQIVDISPLSSLTNLTMLWLDNNQIVDISPLSSLTNLTRLYLTSNQITDLTPASGLGNLQYLNLSGNPISDLTPLSSLRSLVWLWAGSIQTQNLTPLLALVNLRRLNVCCNHISDITPLSALTKLERLHLYINQISNISPLAGLAELRALTLWNNQIANIQALVDNAGLGAGDELDIRYNYLDLTPASDDMQNIQALIARGVDVEYEPQDTPENQPPDTRIVTVNTDSGSGTAEFTWTGNDDTTILANLVYSYRLVRPGPAYDTWSSWISGKTKKYTALSPGSYKFQVRARDAEKVIDPSPASEEFGIGEAPLTCVVNLRPQGAGPSSMGVIGDFQTFDIYVGDSTGGITQVRFSSDESLDGVATGEWTDWFDWDINALFSPWDATAKTMEWSFATGGNKEVWAEVSDATGGPTARDCAPIKVEVPEWRKLAMLGDVLYDPTFLGERAGHVGIYVGDGKAIEALKAGVQETSIVTWDEREEAMLLQVSASLHAKEEAVDFAHGQLGKPYDYKWVQKSSRYDAPSWYCSELVWAAYFNQGVNLEDTPDPWVVTPSEIVMSSLVTIVGHHGDGDPGVALEVRAECPVTLVLTDPDGLRISRETNEISGALYVVDDFNNDGEREISILLGEAKEGKYWIDIQPLEEATPSDTYTVILFDYRNNKQCVLADEVTVADIPSSPYQVTITQENVSPTNAPPEVSLTSPSSTEVILESPYEIRWDATDPDDSAESLNIDLFYSTDGGNTWASIASNEANDGTYNWNISALHGGEHWLKLVAEDPEGGTSEATVGPFTISVFEGNIIVGPNPVTAAGTAFFYTLPEGTSSAKLMIFNVAGRPVFETSLDVDSSRFPSAGTWNPIDQDGVPLANGPYVYVLIADGKVIGQGKMVIQR